MSKSHSTNYTNAEDRHLCGVFLDVSQDPIVGINQSRDQFWKRVTEMFNSEMPSSNIKECNQRSIQCRMQTILKDTRKFNGCLRQIEYMHPSSANELNIIRQANELLMQQKGYKDGFKFDHVWSVLKEYIQNESTSRVSPSFPQENVTESPISSDPSTPSFSINLSDENTSGGSSSQRPQGVKKSKSKRKQSEKMSAFLNTIKEENEKLRELFSTSAANKERDIEVQRQKVEARKQRTEAQMYQYEMTRQDNILSIDLNTIADLVKREYYQEQQQMIMQMRRQSQVQKATNAFDMFGQFPNLGGSGSGLSDY